MQDYNTDLNSEVLELIEQLLELWQKNNNQHLRESNPFYSNDDIAISNNDESIETGSTGIALIFLEVFQKTKDSRYLRAAENIVKQLVEYSKENLTDNFSFYTGRGGVLYAILRLYHLNGDVKLLTQGLRLIAPANEEYLTSQYVNDSLYDGRSGTLLLIYNLYLVTNEHSLLEYINQYVRKILSNANLINNTLQWKISEEINVRPQCGFGFGTSGIAYVFNQISSILSEDIVEYLNSLLSTYQESCWSEENGNWADYSRNIRGQSDLSSLKKIYKSGQYDLLDQPTFNFSWLNGSSGIGLSYLTNPYQKHETVLLRIKKIMESVQSAVINKNIKDESLSCGLSGMGIFSLMAGRRLNDLSYIKIALGIAYDLLSQVRTHMDFKSGLFRGDLGCLYFLIHTIKPWQKTENILLPFALEMQVMDGTEPKLSLSVGNVKRLFLDKYYPRTIYLLEKLSNETFDKYFNKSELNLVRDDVKGFVTYIESFLKQIEGAPFYEPFKEVFYLEKYAYDFLNSETRSDLQIYMGELCHRETITQVLNQPDSWLSKCSLTISDKIGFVRTHWNWTSGADHSKLIQNLFTPPGNHETSFEFSYMPRLIESDLKIDGIVLNRFRESKTIEQALIEIKCYCDTLCDEELKEYVAATASEGAGDFKKRLDFLLWFKIKELLFKGALTINTVGALDDVGALLKIDQKSA